MSIAVGLVGINGIVLATDSQLTMPTYNSQSQKLWKLTDKIGLMSTGYNSGYRHFLVDYYDGVCVPLMNFRIEKLKKEGELPSNYTLNYKDIVDNFAEAIRGHTKRFVDSFNALKVAGGMDFVLAGYDNGVAKLFSIDVNNIVSPFVPSRCGKYHFSGANDVSMYWTRKLNLDNLKLPIEFLKKYAVMVILETIKTNTMCSEPIQMAVIKEDGYHEIAAMDRDGYNDRLGEIEKIKASLDSKQQWLYDDLKDLV